MSQAQDLEAQYGAQNYQPLPVTLVRGQGVEVWDDAGKRYLDFMGAYSAVSHGHCHPKLVEALSQQASQLAVVSRAFYTNKLGPFLKKACEMTGFEKALPMNSGAEAVETAMKAARKWAYTVKGVRPNKAEIIACTNNFHGRTLAIISMSSEPQYQEGFGPLLGGLRTIRYGDIKELELTITTQTAAFIVEPIQGEGGIIVPPTGYLKKCAELCKQHKVLFIVDEVQTGLGRTGKMLAIDHEGVKPDAVILGKALGGGLLPVSLFLANKEVMDVFHPGDHGSTFGGNPLSATVAMRALELLEEEKLVEKAAESGAYLKEQLQALDSPVIKEVRGKGLLLGIEIKPKYSAYELSLLLLKEGLLTKETHKTVIRLAPPLNISRQQLDEGVAIIKRVLSQLAPVPEKNEDDDVEVSVPVFVDTETETENTESVDEKAVKPETSAAPLVSAEPIVIEVPVPMDPKSEPAVIEEPVPETPKAEPIVAEAPAAEVANAEPAAEVTNPEPAKEAETVSAEPASTEEQTSETPCPEATAPEAPKSEPEQGR